MHDALGAVSCMYGRFEIPINKTVTKSTFSRFHLYYKTQHDARHQENKSGIRFDLELVISQANVENIIDMYVIFSLFLSLFHSFLFIPLLSFLILSSYRLFLFHTTYTPVVLTF